MNRRFLEMMRDLGVSTAFEDHLAPLVITNHFLGINTYLMLSKEDGNICISPIAISSTMSMLLCAASEETKSQMIKALGYDIHGLKTEEIAPTVKQQVSTFLENPDHYTLHCASCMLIQKNLDMKDEYKQKIVKAFDTSLFEFDLKAENEKAINKVNEWVKEKMNNAITGITDSLDHDTGITLLNAVYFKGTWKLAFKKEAIYSGNFYSKTTGVKRVDMMYIRKFFYYGENESFKVLQLPYNGEDMCMLFFLPHGRDDLKSVEDSINAHFLRMVTNQLRGLDVEVSLPRFRLECTSHLIPRIQEFIDVSLGVDGLAFKSESGLCASSKAPDVAVNEFSHKVVLEVGEEGTDAEEATVMQLLSPPMVDPIPSQTFVADHPFLFIIFDTKREIILLMGRVTDL